MLGLLLTAWLPYWDALGDSVRFILLWVFASAFGASGYWILVRSFWLRSLRFVDLIKTVALCVPATVLSWVGAGMVTSQGAAQPTSVAWDIGGLMPTAAWWVAFSFSLYWSEVRGNANDSIASTMMA
jgi:hypothetical protein